jgi:hypothetical protein
MREMKFSYHGPHSVFAQPSGEAKLWRYLSIAQLVSMLDKASLHFARADKLDDPFEGSWTKNHAPIVAVDDRGVPISPQPPQEELRKGFPDKIPGWRQANWKWRREMTAVNCWYVGDHESAAMWLTHAVEGIVIETTFAHFLGSLPSPVTMTEESQAIQVGLVQYVDYETAIMPPNNSHWPFIHKRKSFEHEHELRAVIQAIGSNMVDVGTFQFVESGVPPEGVLVPVDIVELIRKVHVAPSSPAWFADAVRAIVQRFGHGFPVEHSHLDATPFH